MAGNQERLVNVNSEKDFDVSVVKKMTNCQLVCSVNPLFHWPIVENFFELVNADKFWVSEEFPLNGNRQAFGRMNLHYSKSKWNVCLTLTRYDHVRVSNINSYFVCKYKFTNDTNPTGVEHTCEQRLVFGTIRNTTAASVAWMYRPSQRLRFILIEIYQFPADIPRYLTLNINVVVGQIRRFSEQTRGNSFGDQVAVVESRRVNFGSEGDQDMVVRSFSNPNRLESLSLFSVTLNFFKDVEEPDSRAPFVVTFTVFSEKKNIQDFVKRVVLRGGETEEFDRVLTLTFYEEIDKLLVNDVLYYKVVLDPL